VLSSWETVRKTPRLSPQIRTHEKAGGRNAASSCDGYCEDLGSTEIGGANLAKLIQLSHDFKTTYVP